ncbi:mCG1041725 [Mus musculus]|nr:mCG1041725 [Mus musculus]
MGSGSWWIVIDLLLWRETPTSWSLLPRHQGFQGTAGPEQGRQGCGSPSLVLRRL